ncbi:hypothetical protein C8Q80DRAFT_197523 [Daedaleopsis nitida]|nr:hypothetical protein C8Q80DRAFT_197523 [Daedaleopsis nitida]
MGDTSVVETSRAELPDMSCNVDSDGYIIDQYDGGVPFWKAYKPWLAKHGFTLYDFKLIEPTHLFETWFPPTVSTSAPLPFAIRLNHGVESPPGQAIGHNDENIGRIPHQSVSSRDIRSLEPCCFSLHTHAGRHVGFPTRFRIHGHSLVECMSQSRQVRHCWPDFIVYQMPFDGTIFPSQAPDSTSPNAMS